jgi:predicted O-methyltransferase YrrM
LSARSIHLTDKLYQYLLAVSLRDDGLLRRLRRETERMPMGGMQIAREQGQFMALLVELMGAKKALEVGTFTGYSSLCVARALPADGRLVCCDVSEAFTKVARKYWREAGVAGKVTLELGPALGTLDRLIAGGSAGSFDFAFIDADKPNYRNYYERCLELVRPGGLIAVDNVLWGGSVADARKKDADTKAIRAFNRRLKGDPRILLSMLPLGDGLSLALKRR